MTPLQRAIEICGTQAELAFRVNGKRATGHVYYWLRNGVSPEVAVEIERAVREVIATDPDAAVRATLLGGVVTVEQLLPELQWSRDMHGRVLSFTTLVQTRAA